MNIKQFLRPDWRKIVLTIFLMIISFPSYGPFYRGSGFPLVYLTPGKCPAPIGPDLYNIPSCVATKFIPTNLVVDIIILYLFSCVIVWIYDSIKKKNE